MQITQTKRFTLTANEVAEAIKYYLRREHNVEVEKVEFNVNNVASASSQFSDAPDHYVLTGAIAV